MDTFHHLLNFLLGPFSVPLLRRLGERRPLLNALSGSATISTDEVMCVKVGDVSDLDLCFALGTVI